MNYATMNSEKSIIFSYDAWAIWLLWLTWLVFILWRAEYGVISVNNEIDWTHHAALAEILYQGEAPQNHRNSLGEFGGYPALAHRLVAVLAQAFALPVPQALQIVQLLALVLCSIFAALKLAGALHPHGSEAYGRCVIVFTSRSAVALSCAVVLLNLAAYYGLNFSGMLQFQNHFFSQLAGTALALAGHLTIQRGLAGGRVIGTLALYGLLAWIIGQVHTLPALWFVLAGGLCYLALDGRPLKGISIFCAALLGAGSILYFQPGTQETLNTAALTAGKGGYTLHGGYDLQHQRAAMLWALSAVTAILAVVVLAVRLSGARWRYILFNRFSGILAVTLLAWATLAQLLLIGAEASYPLAKYSTLFVIESVILLTAGIAHLGARSFVGVTVKQAFAYPLIVSLLFLSQWPLIRSAPVYSNWPISLSENRSQQELLEIRAALDENREQITNHAGGLYPLFAALSGFENCYLAIGVLHRSRAGFWQWGREIWEKDSAEASRSILGPEWLPALYSPWDGRLIRFPSEKARRFALFAGVGWQRPEAGVYWLDGKHSAHVLLALEKKLYNVPVRTLKIGIVTKIIPYAQPIEIIIDDTSRFSIMPENQSTIERSFEITLHSGKSRNLKITFPPSGVPLGVSYLSLADVT